MLLEEERSKNSLSFSTRIFIVLLLLLLPLEIWMFLSDRHFLWKENNEDNPRIEVAQVQQVSGSVHVRWPHSLSWGKLGEKTILYEGDEVTTLDHSKVILKFLDGQLITLTANSLLVLKKHLDLETSRVIMKLVSGRLEQEGEGVSDDAKLEIELSNETVIARGRSKVVITQNKMAPASVHVASGDVRVIEKTASASYLNLNSRRIVPTTNALPQPVLLRPHIETNVEAVSTPLKTPKLKPAEIEYPDQTSVSRSMIQELMDFIVPPAYAEEKPQKNSYTVNLAWQPLANVASYHIQIATDFEFRGVVVERHTKQPQLKWSTPAAGYYYWRVAAVDADGLQGPFSEFLTFHIRPVSADPHDETSFESYRPYDEYNKLENTLRILYGPYVTAFYNLHPRDKTVSSNEIKYSGYGLIAMQFDYSRKLDPYYSLDTSFGFFSQSLESQNFKGTVTDSKIKQDNMVITVGVERRFFEPHHYWFIQAGGQIFYTDLVGNKPTNPSVLFQDQLSFFGGYFGGGWGRIFRNKVELKIYAGAIAQYGIESYRLAQYATVDSKYLLKQNLSLGLRVREKFSYYDINTENIDARIFMLNFVPQFILEFKF